MGKLDRYTIVIDGDNQKLELAAKKTIGDLSKVGKAANDSNGNVGKLAAGVRQASTNVAAFQGPLGGVSGRLGALATMLGNTNPLMAGLGLAISGVTILMAGAVAEFDEFNLRNKKTEALLKATGSASGYTGEQLDKMAKSVALNTLASVEGIKDTQNVLLTFKGIAKSAFEDAIVLSQDMASVMGTDSKSAALQLGKALESPTSGITSLKKAGVSFSQAERDMIRDMENVGRVVDAQTFILETLKNQIGGTGSAEADGTVVGAVDTLSQHWQQLKINVADSSGAATMAADFINLIGSAAAGWNDILFSDDQTELTKLTARRMELKAELAALHGGERATFLSYIVGSSSEAKNVERELKAVTEKMVEIQDRRKNQLVAQSEANAAADKYAAKRTEEQIALKAAADAKDLARIHDKGAASVAAMEMQFADEEEKINLNYDKNLLRIESWQVSEAELKRRGYENMEALREEYRVLAGEKMDADFLAIEDKVARQKEKELRAEEKSQEDKLKLVDRANSMKLAMEKKVQGNLLRLGHTMAGENKKLQLAMLAIETVIGAKESIVAGYVGGMKAAAAMAPMGPVAAKAANADMIRMGYTNAALIGATGIAQGISLSNGGDTGGSVGSYFESGVEPTVQSNDEAVTSINSAAERRAGGDVVYNGPYIEKVEAMDSESFDDFAQRNSNSIARATAAGYEEYGVNLSA